MASGVGWNCRIWKDDVSFSTDTYITLHQRYRYGYFSYSEVTEGGVTRRVARAMEVLHASAPGARVRVMRAAYHSSSGPGIPASSYLVHSSRQVLSSGIDFMETPNLPIKPLEISSTPLDSSPDSETDKENYKVTEPDDFEISEPSKWRGSTVKKSIRLPSEESSSTDNASIIDLDSLSSRRNTFRRSFRDKEKGVNTSQKRISPLLDAPVALSTLKYTSLLNGSEDWNDRRKSYSFEDTSPLHKSSIRESDSLTIDSSTDSGIYKSTEIVEDKKSMSTTVSKENVNAEDNTFQDWLFRNRSSKFNSMKPFHVSDAPLSSNISPSGKVSITVPITIESDNTNSIKSENFEDNDRKTKKVGFCKTELHFAAESGTVNIIATDEKPPPSNDFRKRRSAFVPLNDRFEKSITLFGDKVEQSNLMMDDDISLTFESVDNHENTAATKSILKNKIPKPKPYLLGENMNFGDAKTNTYNRIQDNETPLSAISLINRQLQTRRRYSDETTLSSSSDSNKNTNFLNTLRTTQKGPEKNEGTVRNHKIEKLDILQGKKSYLPSLPSNLQGNKTRELRVSDLAYFGINGKEKDTNTHSQDNMQEEILHSVKLVQQISNSVSNSEIDSDDAPEYENLPTITNFIVIPTPKPRSKYKIDTNILNESRSLKPIPEQTNDLPLNITGCKLKLKEVKETSQKSIKTKTNTVEPKHMSTYSSSLRRYKNDDHLKCKKEIDNVHVTNGKVSPKVQINGKLSPIYVNLKDEKINWKPSHVTKKTLERDSSAKRLASHCKEKECKKDKNIKVSAVEGNFEIQEMKNKSKVVKQPSLIRQNSSPYSNKSDSSLSKNKCNQREISTSKNINANSINNVKNYSKNVNSLESKERLLNDGKESNSDKEIKKKSAGRATYHNSNKENKDQFSHDFHNSKNISGKTDTPMSETNSKKNKYTRLENDDHKNNIQSDHTKKPKRSQYVINYDDKHGTVSSICKIKPGTGSHRRKISEHENSPKVHYIKNNITNKNILQQHPDQQRITTEPKRKITGKKQRINTHNTCLLL